MLPSHLNCVVALPSAYEARARAILWKFALLRMWCSYFLITRKMFLWCVWVFANSVKYSFATSTNWYSAWFRSDVILNRTLLTRINGAKDFEYCVCANVDHPQWSQYSHDFALVTGLLKYSILDCKIRSLWNFDTVFSGSVATQWRWGDRFYSRYRCRDHSDYNSERC